MKRDVSNPKACEDENLKSTIKLHRLNSHPKPTTLINFNTSIECTKTFHLANNSKYVIDKFVNLKIRVIATRQHCPCLYH